MTPAPRHYTINFGCLGALIFIAVFWVVFAVLLRGFWVLW